VGVFDFVVVVVVDDDGVAIKSDVSLSLESFVSVDFGFDDVDDVICFVFRIRSGPIPTSFQFGCCCFFSGELHSELDDDGDFGMRRKSFARH